MYDNFEPYNSDYYTKNFQVYKGQKVFNRVNLHDRYAQIGVSGKPIERKSENCIYCGNPFKHEKVNHAHLIPDLFGRNKSRNAYECNTCNEQSAKWETSLGTFTLPLRVVGRVKNKRGKIPKFKSRLDGFEHKTEIYFDKEGILQTKLATMDDCKFDEKEGLSKLTFRLGSYNPYHVYKAFLKIAISLMPNEILEKEKWMVKYLSKESIDHHIFPLIYMIYIDNKTVEEPFFELRKYIGNHKYHPEYMLIAYFGKSMVQILLPIKNPEKKVFFHHPPIWEILGVRKIYRLEQIDIANNFNEKRDWDFEVSTYNQRP